MSLFRKPLFWVVLALVVVIVVVAVVALGGSSEDKNAETENKPAAAEEQTASYDDPFAYCAAVDTVDKPDARYTGEDVPEAVVSALRAAIEEAPKELSAENTVWRCMDGQVWACFEGAETPCATEPDAEGWYQLSAPESGE